MTQSIEKKPAVSRRRFLKICAAGLPALSLAGGSGQAFGAARLHRWTGLALGAGAEIHLLHDDAATAQELFAGIEAEIRRLEGIFSLYRPDSELVRLNRQGRIAAPSPELLDLLSLCRSLHAATGGALDPTIQPLWQHHARQAAGEAVSDPEHLRRLIGFEKVRFQPGEIVFSRPDMAMTFNGIAQGYVTDRVTSFMAANGCRDILVNLGEIAARGSAVDLPLEDQAGWPVTLRPDRERTSDTQKIRLENAAVASSARLGTTFDPDGGRSHILDPATGLPVENGLSGASVLAATAALADGLSTAALVCSEAQLVTALGAFPGTRAFVVRENDSSGWLDG